MQPSWLGYMTREVFELRWCVLALICFITFGGSFIYDFPGSIGTGTEHTIEAAFRAQGKPYTQSMNQLLYSVYSWPNTVLAMLGGLLIDRYLGLHRASLLFMLLVWLGSITFYAGVRKTNYSLLLIGRTVFGLGGESLGVAQSSYVARWFKGGGGLSLAFCITISFARVGSSFNFIFTPMIARERSIDDAVLVGVLACALSFASCVSLTLVDMYAVRVEYIKPEVYGPQSLVDEDGVTYDAGEVSHTAAPDDAVAGAALRNDDDDGDNGADAQNDAGEDVQIVYAEVEHNALPMMRFSDVYSLSVEFWLLCAICTLCYSSIAPFFGILRNFFEVKYGFSGDRASKYISSYQLTAAFGSPVVGIIVDLVGRNTWWLVVSDFFIVVVNLAFLFTMIPPIVLMMILGCASCFLSSSLWPAVPWVVPDNMLGFSYGVMTAVQNIGLAVVPIAVGVILDHYTPQQTPSSNHRADGSSSSSIGSLSICTDSSPPAVDALPSIVGYQWTEVMFTSIGGMSLIACVLLLIYDVRHNNGLLTVTATRRRALLEEQEEYDTDE